VTVPKNLEQYQPDVNSVFVGLRNSREHGTVEESI
jgi:hypothetical protein